MTAQGIEAAVAAETVKHGSVHESPVGNADAPKSQSNHSRGTPPMTPTDAMIEAGFQVFWGTELSALSDVPANYKRTCAAIYTAMESARDPDELREALEHARDFLMTAPLESGVCCCGDAVEGHNIGSGHSPVDSIQYAAAQEVERIDAILQGTKQ